MQFDNRPPINLDAAKHIAHAETDGGCYDGIGYNRYWVYQGKRLHLVHAHSSGCDHGSGTDSSCNHLGHWPDAPSLIRWLIKQIEDQGGLWWASELLGHLGYKGEEA